MTEPRWLTRARAGFAATYPPPPHLQGATMLANPARRLVISAFAPLFKEKASSVRALEALAPHDRGQSCGSENASARDWFRVP